MTVTPPSHYDVLGVPTSATHAEVRAAYRAAARDHHPDAGGDPGRMRALNVAWAVLGDPVRRAAYDRVLAGDARDRQFVAPDEAPPTYTPWADDGDRWPIDPDARLTADEWADLADGRPIAPTRALVGWWAILPPAMLLSALGLFVAGIFFTAPTLMALAAGAFIASAGLFVLAPLRAMARGPRS
jgi:DnaJ domain